MSKETKKNPYLKRSLPPSTATSSSTRTPTITNSTSAFTDPLNYDGAYSSTWGSMPPPSSSNSSRPPPSSSLSHHMHHPLASTSKGSTGTSSTNTSSTPSLTLMPSDEKQDIDFPLPSRTLNYRPPSTPKIVSDDDDDDDEDAYYLQAAQVGAKGVDKSHPEDESSKQYNNDDEEEEEEPFDEIMSYCPKNKIAKPSHLDMTDMELTTTSSHHNNYLSQPNLHSDMNPPSATAIGTYNSTTSNNNNNSNSNNNNNNRANNTISLPTGDDPFQYNDNDTFLQTWNEAEGEWKNAQNDDNAKENQHYISQDEDEVDMMNQMNDHNRMNNIHNRNGQQQIVQDEEVFEFESFAGGRSSTVAGCESTVASSTLAGEKQLLDELTLSSKGNSQVNLGPNMAGPPVPVSILRSSRFDSNHHYGNMATVPLQQTNEMMAGHQELQEDSTITTKPDLKLPRREHPWDRKTPMEDHPTEIGNDENTTTITPDPLQDTNHSNPSTPKSNDTGDRKSKKGKRRSNRRRVANDDNEDDDTSIEDEDPTSGGTTKKRADTLQDRTKQAWSVRNRVTAAAAATNNPKTKQSSRPNKHVVTFQKDTVHEFTPEAKNESEEGDEEETQHSDYSSVYYDDDTTLGGASAYSTYTKSNESEMEDMIRDFFLIGEGDDTNPGRRKRRSSQNRRKGMIVDTLEVEYHEEDATTITHLSNEDPSPSPDRNQIKRKSRSRKSSSSSPDNHDADIENDDESDSHPPSLVMSPNSDPCNLVWNCVEDGMSMMNSLLFCHDENKGGISSLISNGLANDEVTKVKETPLDQWIMRTQKKPSLLNDMKCGTDTTEEPVNRIQKQIEFLQVAINAARKSHELKGLTYDEGTSLDLETEIKFVVMTVPLPIGITFEESDCCCWVDRVFDRGNAVTSSSGDKVEPGDQLASINGQSALTKSVTSICKMLANAATPLNESSVELFFLRYVGPLRPSAPPANDASSQQGYEIIDPVLNMPTRTPTAPQGKFSPIRKFTSDNFLNSISFSSRDSKSTKSVSQMDDKSIISDTMSMNSIPISQSSPVQQKSPIARLSPLRKKKGEKSKKQLEVKNNPANNNVSARSLNQGSFNPNSIEQPVLEKKGSKKKFGFLRLNRRKKKSERSLKTV